MRGTHHVRGLFIIASTLTLIFGGLHPAQAAPGSGLDAVSDDNDKGITIELLKQLEWEESGSSDGNSKSPDVRVYNYCAEHGLTENSECLKATASTCVKPNTELIFVEYLESGRKESDCVPNEDIEEAKMGRIQSLAREQLLELSIGIGSVKFEPTLLGFGYKGKHTNMYVEAATETTTDVLLDERVEIRAKPVRFNWKYGDGTERTTYDPGSPLPDYDGTGEMINKMDFATPTSHVYEETGIYPVTVNVTYYGEYRVNGETWESIPGSISVDSSPGEADIWTQNSRWVSGACESQDQWGCNGPVQFDPSTDRPPKIYQDQYDENGRWIGPVN